MYKSQLPRSVKAHELKVLAQKAGVEGEVFENVNDALLQAKSRAGFGDLILVTGSTFVVAEIEDL